MKVAPKALKQPVILFFDQFEQFFVHQRKLADRQPFIQVLTHWYQAKPAIPVKILVGIRADLLHELYELQQALGYTLGRYDMFKLEKFEPEEAAAILQVIAETEAWEFNRSFITQLAKEELAAGNGKISPVDLQILAETVRKQPPSQQAFKEETFRKLGGLEGLLNRYLEETLEVLKANNLYQAGIQVLLALIDREQGVRSGVLTLAELQEKLKGAVRPQEVQQATNWLASGDVRLITPVERQNTPGYELAHEQIIPAVVRLAGQELKTAERANQLLERRVNEWLGNGRSRRYLLSWREVWLLRQQQAYLVWGDKRRDKEKLLTQSWQRLYRAGWAVLLALLLALAGFLVWLSPPGQRWQMQRDLAGLSQKVSYEAHADVALTFAQSGNLQQAFKFADSISDSYQRANALKSIAEAYSKISPDIAKSDLEQLRTSAASISDSDDKTVILSSIAVAYSKINRPDEAKLLLEQARISADSISSDNLAKANALKSIAEAYSKISPDIAKPDLEQLRSSADSILNPYDKAIILSSIAAAYSKINQPDGAHEAKLLLEQARTSADSISSDYLASKADALKPIAAAYSKLPSDIAKSGLEQLRSSADSISDSDDKTVILSSIAVAYSKINQPHEAKLLLEQARTSADSILDPYDKAVILSSIAVAYSKINQPDGAHEAKLLLEQARTSADSISYDSSVKTLAFQSIAEVYSKLPSDIAKSGLEQLRSSADSISDSDDKTVILSSIAVAYSKINQPHEAKLLLEQARTSADSISYASTLRPFALQSLAQAYATLQDWRQVNLIAASCDSIECKANILWVGLTTWAEQQHPELKEPEEEE